MFLSDIDCYSTNFIVGTCVGIFIAWIAQGVGILFEYLCKKLKEWKK